MTHTPMTHNSRKTPKNPPKSRLTWRSLVRDALRSLGGTASLADLYRTVETHAKTEENPHWKAKVRQVVQLDPMIERVGSGVWRLKPKT